MSGQPPPQWQPISKVFLVGTMVDGMLELAQEQYTLLQEAWSKPHILDDDTVRRVVEVYTAQRDDTSPLSPGSPDKLVNWIASCRSRSLR